jgi:hypothetical protein
VPQLHFYVPDKVAIEVKRRAEAHGLTLSRYVAQLVRREISGAWPKGYFENVVGGWKGQPLQRPPQLEIEDRDLL